MCIRDSHENVVICWRHSRRYGHFYCRLLAMTFWVKNFRGECKALLEARFIYRCESLPGPSLIPESRNVHALTKTSSIFPRSRPTPAGTPCMHCTIQTRWQLSNLRSYQSSRPMELLQPQGCYEYSRDSNRSSTWSSNNFQLCFLSSSILDIKIYVSVYSWAFTSGATVVGYVATTAWWRFSLTFLSW